MTTPLSVRCIAANHEDGVHIQLFLYNQSNQDLDDVSVCLEGFHSPLQLSFSDITCEQQNGLTTVQFGSIEKHHTACCHGLICLQADPRG